MSANYDIVKGRNDKDKVRGHRSKQEFNGRQYILFLYQFSKPSYKIQHAFCYHHKSGAGCFQLGISDVWFYGSLEVEGYGLGF